MSSRAPLRLTALLVVAAVLSLGMTGCSTQGPAGAAASGTPTPSPTPTLDPIVAKELVRALKGVRAIPGVASASYEVSLSQPPATDPTGLPAEGESTAPPAPHFFGATFTVAMSADATPKQAAQVPVAMSDVIAWTAVTLVLTTPAATGRVATTVYYDGTFDQHIEAATALGIAEGLDTIAGTPGVVDVTANIPYTMVVGYGSLQVDVSPADDATTDRVRGVIDGTAFKNTTLHGSFSNGAKP